MSTASKHQLYGIFSFNPQPKLFAPLLAPKDMPPLSFYVLGLANVTCRQVAYSRLFDE